MTLHAIQKLTLIDYPEKLACTLFLRGCNFRCPWCYSPELVNLNMERKVLEKELFSFLEERKGKLEGVVLCGGEPTINQELLQLCSKIKNLGYEIKLDTNGSNPLLLRKLVSEKLIDYVAMDVKSPKERYSEAAGVVVDLDKIEQSICFLKKGNIDYEFRTTAHPLLKKQDIISIANWLKPAKKYYLQQFRPEKTLNPDFVNLKGLSEEELLEIKDEISDFFEICDVR